MEPVVKPKVIFFDFGDTLVHFKKSVYESWSRLLKEHGLLSQSVNVICRKIHTAIRREWAVRNGDDITWVKDEETEREYWRSFYEAVLVQMDLEEVSGEVVAEFIRQQMDPNSYDLFDDVREILKALKAAGYNLGIISNAFPSATKIFDQQKIQEYFTYFFWSYESFRDHGILPKPDASELGLYRFVLESIGVEPEETLFFDDRPTFVSGALEAGMGAVLLDREGIHSDWENGLKINLLNEIQAKILAGIREEPKIYQVDVGKSIEIDGNVQKTIIISGDHNTVNIGKGSESAEQFSGTEQVGKEGTKDRHYQTYNLILASPEDVLSERKQVFVWVDELNEEFAEEDLPYRLAIKMLKKNTGLVKHTYQQHIPIEEVHIFFGLLWQRMGIRPGTFPPDDGKPFYSGNEEEITRFFDAQRLNETGLPIIRFFWKQDLYLPENATEEYIQQYRKVIVFSENCKSDGEHPAKVIPFKTGELEKKIKDELRLVVEKTHSGNVTLEAGLVSWLKLARLRKHPFDYFVTEDDLSSTIENFYSDNFNIKELRADHRVHLVVGVKGSGKTALAEYLMSKCYPKNVSSNIYSLYWGKAQFLKLLAVKSLKSLTPIYYAREIVQKIIDDIDNSGQQISKLLEVPQNTNYFEATPLFSALLSVLARLGYGKLMVCIDQIDQIPGIGRETEKLIKVIEPLLQVMEQIDCKDFGVRFFLPDYLLDELIKRESVHFDHMIIDRLEWEDLDIQLMLTQRLHSSSITLRSPVHSLGQLAEIKNFDRRLVGLANQNPRSAIWLARELINQHCKIDPSVLQFSDQEWLEVQKTWFRSEEILGDKRNKGIGFHISAFGRIYFYDQEIPVKGTRADIMRFLIDKKAGISTDEEIARIIYPEADPSDLSNRVVTEAIRHLKDELAKYGLEQHIERVRGKGFILLDDLEE